MGEVLILAAVEEAFMPLRSTARRVAPAALIGLLALGGCGAPSLLGEGDLPTKAVILDEQAAAAMISRYRAQHGLGPVSVDGGLVSAASHAASANAQAGRLSHDLGGAFASRMAAAGLGRSYAAENLSAGSETFEQVFARWRASPQHNSNMLIPQIRRIGIARVDSPGSRYRRYWALVLGG